MADANEALLMAKNTNLGTASCCAWSITSGNQASNVMGKTMEAEGSGIFARIIIYICKHKNTPTMKHFYHALVVVAVFLAFSCTKQPVIEYDLDHISGKWLVTSTTGEIVIMHDNTFAVNDTVRFYKGVEDFFISRPGENRYYEEYKDIHYFSRFGGMISEDRLSFVVLADRAYTFELIESAKDRLVFQYKDNGAKAVLKKEE